MAVSVSELGVLSSLIVQRIDSKDGIQYNVSISGDGEFIGIPLWDYEQFLKYLATVNLSDSTLRFGNIVLDFVDFDPDRLVFIMKKI